MFVLTEPLEMAKNGVMSPVSIVEFTRNVFCETFCLERFARIQVPFKRLKVGGGKKRLKGERREVWKHPTT